VEIFFAFLEPPDFFVASRGRRVRKCFFARFFFDDVPQNSPFGLLLLDASKEK
jgi:hypothetical protein